MKKLRHLFIMIVTAIACSTFMSCDDLFYDDITGTWECYYSGNVGLDKYEYSIITTYTRSGDYYLEYEEWVNGYRNDYYTASGYYDCIGSRLEVTYWIEGSDREVYENARYNLSGDRLLITYSDGLEELYTRSR